MKTKTTKGKIDDLSWRIENKTLTISGNGDIPAYSYSSNGTTAPWGSEFTDVTIKDGIESISDSAFYGCKKLINVSIPKSVKFIGEKAFQCCDNLKSVNLENSSIKTIGKLAFADCRNLKSIIFPETIKTIGRGAFHGCWHLRKITIPKTIETIEEYAFLDCGCLTKIANGEIVFQSITASLPNNEV